MKAKGLSARYIYDNEDILLELDGSNNIIARYTHGPGIDEPLVMEKGGASFFYHADGLGSITEITNSSGAVVQAYTYSSFGKIESQLDPAFIQPYTFTSREFDPETGLHFYRARYYDPAAGRFLQQDPVKGQREIPQSQNLYPYVINDPVRLKDPTGEVIPLAVALVGVGALAGGSLEAMDSLLKGGGAGDVFKAFGRGAIAGGLGTITAIAVGAATGNPFLVGASAGLTFDFMRQGIANGFQIQCIDVGSLAFSTLTGAALGPVASRIPGLRLVGREPNLFQPRSLSEFGPNSVRLLQQETIGAGLGSIADQLYDAFPRAFRK